MFTLFTCGCIYRGNCACTERCDEHNGLVCGYHMSERTLRPKTVIRAAYATVTFDGKHRSAIADKNKYDYVITALDPTPLRIQSLNSYNLNDVQVLLSARALRVGGTAIFFVPLDCIAITTALACHNNFNVLSITPIHLSGQDLFALVCTNVKEPELDVKFVAGYTPTNLFKQLPTGTVLDLTCINPAIVKSAARSKHTVVGYCYSESTFRQLQRSEMFNGD